MQRFIPTWKDPYDAGFELFGPDQITLDEGVTVLVGCNGSGKSTFLKNVEEYLEANKIANIVLKDELTPEVMASDKWIEPIRRFMLTGSTSERFTSDDTSDERWILFDSIDYGWSIDNIQDFKNKILEVIKRDAYNLQIHLFIIITANSYEMTIGLPCLDVYSGHLVNFDSYEKYRSFIIKTRHRKDDRHGYEKGEHEDV